MSLTFMAFTAFKAFEAFYLHFFYINGIVFQPYSLPQIIINSLNGADLAKKLLG